MQYSVSGIEDRGVLLRREFEDATARLRRSGSEITLELMRTLTDCQDLLLQRVGPWSDLSEEAKLDYARMLVRLAERQFQTSLGKAYGLAILAMHLEASALQGPDARFVSSRTEEIIAGAMRARAALNSSASEQLTAAA